MLGIGKRQFVTIPVSLVGLTMTFETTPKGSSVGLSVGCGVLVGAGELVGAGDLVGAAGTFGNSFCKTG